MCLRAFPPFEICRLVCYVFIGVKSVHLCQISFDIDSIFCALYFGFPENGVCVIGDPVTGLNIVTVK